MRENIKKKCGKILLPLIALAGCGACALTLVGCGGQYLTEQDIIDSGYSVKVVLDYNGGKTEDDETSTTLRLRPNSYVPQPKEDEEGLKPPIRTGHTFKEFRVAETDEDGNPLRNEDGSLKLGELWDFDTQVTEDVTLGAVWWTNYKMILHYGEEENGVQNPNTKEIDVPRTSSGGPTRISQSASRVSGYTFLRYYTDRNDKDGSAVTFPAVLDFTDENDVIDVYSDSLNGVFQIVGTAEQLVSFSFSSSTNVYLTANIDMNDLKEAGSNKKLGLPATYGGKFYGNDYTISNIEIEYEKPTSGTDGNFGLFKTISASAEIRDLKLVNTKVIANLSNRLVSEYNVGLFAGLIRNGATIENVDIDGELVYTVLDGYDEEKVHVDKFIGTVNSGANITNCVYENITVTKGNNG